MEKDFSPEMLQFFLNVGFVGIEQGYFEEAQTLFDIVNKICPNDLNAQLSIGLGEACMGKLVDGVKRLFNVLKKDPTNELAKSFIAVAFKLGKVDAEALRCVQDILKNSQDAVAKEIAQGILDSYKGSITPQKLQAEQCARLSQEVYVH